MRLRRATAGVDRDDALGLSRRNGSISSMHAGEESAVLLLEAVFVDWFIRILMWTGIRTLIPSPGPPQAHCWIGIQQDSQVRLQISTEDTMQIKHILAAQLATIALISFRGVGEAITKYNLPVFHRRLDYLCYVLGSRSKH